MPLNSISQFQKGPLDKLDYEWDWSKWLRSGEVITTASFIVPSGIEFVIGGNTDTTATAWLNGGNLGTNYMVGCTVTTSASRVENRNILLSIVQR